MSHSISKYIFFTAFVSAVITSKGQVREPAMPVSEMVYVHTDRGVYVAGESIRYKAYLVNLSDFRSPCSRIMYFCLTGTGRDNTMSWRINMDSSSVWGVLPIPEDTKPGMYVLTAYTDWMRNNPSSTWFSDRIMITSLKAEAVPVMRFFSPQSLHGDNESLSEITLKLASAKSEISAGENMELMLDLKSNEKVNADLSISVTAESPFDSLLSDPDMESVINNAIRRASNPRYFTVCRYKIEDRGFILTGRIISTQNEPRNRCDVWLAVRDSVSPRIVFAPVDTAGVFRFFLNRAFDNKELIIQLCDPGMAADCRIEIFGKSALPADTVTKPYSVGISEQEYINSVNNVRLVEAVYGSNIQPPEIPVSKAASAFLQVPNRVVIPSEYADLRNFREIAGNILPEVRFGTRHEEFFLEVLSPNVNSWKDNHMVMLNGVPFTDLAYISTLGTKEIRRIEIIQPNILVGRATIPGLVSIFTYDGKIPESYLRSRTVRYQNTVLPAMPVTELQPTAGGKPSNYPDFRNCVYWEPFIKMSSGNQIKITFPAGLLAGKFVIRAQGITSNGSPISATGYYQVNEK